VGGILTLNLVFPLGISPLEEQGDPDQEEGRTTIYWLSHTLPPDATPTLSLVRSSKS